jgi:hypothetical protein
MAGSRTLRQYTDDAGNNYTISIDESNAEGTTPNGNTLMPPRTVNSPDLPRSFKPRYVLAYLQDNPQVRRKFKIGGAAQVSELVAVGATIQAAVNASVADDSGGEIGTFVVTAYRGERVNLRPAVGGNATDTGLDDGDAD